MKDALVAAMMEKMSAASLETSMALGLVEVMDKLLGGWKVVEKEKMSV